MDAPRNDISIAYIAAAPANIFDFICLWNSLQSPAKFIFLYKKLNTIILFFLATISQLRFSLRLSARCGGGRALSANPENTA